MQIAWPAEHGLFAVDGWLCVQLALDMTWTGCLVPRRLRPWDGHLSAPLMGPGRAAHGYTLPARNAR